MKNEQTVANTGRRMKKSTNKAGSRLCLGWSGAAHLVHVLAVGAVPRAELLDEGLDIVAGLWHGQPFTYDGKHYHVRPIDFFPPPPPVQQPRIPIWVVGLWPAARSMRRAARWDGLLPYIREENGAPAAIQPTDIRDMSSWLQQHRSETGPYDIVMEGRTSGRDMDEIERTIRPLAEAGVTWWLEAMWTEPNDLHAVQQRLEAGPPRIR